MHRLVLISAAFSCLFGCTWLSPGSLSKYSLDYNAAIQDSGDKLLVINVLRARDQAPLHFGDVPSIHETVQFTAGVTPTLMFGPIRPASASSMVAPTASIQDSPSFEMDNLDTQDFIQGVMSPIEPKVVKYWLDRGLDQRIALLLFFSSMTISYDAPSDGRTKAEKPKEPAETVFVLNEPRARVPVVEPPSLMDGRRLVHTKQGIDVDKSLKHELPFLTYLSIIDWINGRLAAVASDDKTAVGPPVYLGNNTMEKYFKDIARIDPKNYELDPVKDQKAKKGWYQLYAVSDNKVVSLCLSGGASLAIKGGAKPDKPAAAPDAKSDDDDDPCKGAPVSEPPTAGQTHPKCPTLASWVADPGTCEIDKKRLHFAFGLRSAGDVVHFLGDLVYLQENPFELQPGNHVNNPVTLGFPTGTNPDDGGALFTLSHGAVPGRFQVAYVDGSYTVGNASDHDHTLEVLSILTQLINLNKSAKDLRETPTVKIIP
jgi:hypothetical protein